MTISKTMVTGMAFMSAIHDGSILSKISKLFGIKFGFSLGADPEVAAAETLKVRKSGHKFKIWSQNLVRNLRSGHNIWSLFS